LRFEFLNVHLSISRLACAVSMHYV
jgi:hypothetical protein